LPGSSQLERVRQTFSLLGDSARLKIIFCLLGGEKCVCQIQQETDARQSVTSHHLNLLKKGRLVSSRREGKNIYYSLADEHISTILQNTYTHIQEEDLHETST